MKIEKYWQQILNSIPDGITITDLKGTIIYVSRQIMEIFRASHEDEILGTKLIDWIHPDDRETALFYIMNASLGIPTNGAAEYRMIRQDKTAVYLESKGTTLRDDKGTSIGMIYSSRDISKRKKLETAQELSGKLKSIETLASGIAHDFNNILTVVRGHLSLIKEDDSINTNISYSIDEANKAILQAKNITRELYFMAKGGILVKEPFNIDILLKETANLIIQDPNIICEHLYNSDFTINADKNQITRVLSNIILNAKEAMPEGGKIKFKMGWIEGFKHKFLFPRKKYLSLSITDTGKGISDENLSRIYDPYFSTKSRGSGLGLFTSFSILQKHEGYLDVNSTINQGTVFTLFLPK
ncbi:MAG: ATP-binding protein [Spirochaetales bacterium]|nr:ATP-binding protein [Spirochaetales bacterium]